jgi:ubiquinone/menaquinone biosynthesis C-methylase UbiE
MTKVQIQSVEDQKDLFEWIKKVVEGDALTYYGLGEKDPLVVDAVNYFSSSDQHAQDFRFEDLLICGIAPGSNARILDMASGFGQFVLAALARGYDCWGLEPAETRLCFVRKKIELLGMPKFYLERFKEGVGENIPFSENTFDLITSFQTLEHVQDLGAVVLSMLKVVKSGGGIHIRCPNYFGTFEGHYRLPWLPFPFSKKPMELILRILGRPTSGLSQQINLITRGELIRKFTIAANKLGIRVLIFDLVDTVLESGIRRRGIPVTFFTLTIAKLAIFFRDVFRREKSINLYVRVIKCD